MPSNITTEPITLSVNGLHFDGIAAGPRTGELVLFLHGFPEFADAWLNIQQLVAAAGFRAVAMNQRGYSPRARPPHVQDYAIKHLCNDVLGFADTLGAERFHLVAHDWGGFLAWQIASEYSARLHSLSVLSTAHINAFLDALKNDEDQKQRSKYIDFFRMPGGAAESYFQANNYQALRRVYQNKVPDELVDKNIQRLAEPGALTAALNWYRALDLNVRIGPIPVPTLYIWGSNDLAAGESAANATAQYVSAPYRFERLEGKSHWLLEETPNLISPLLLQHLKHPSFL